MKIAPQTIAAESLPSGFRYAGVAAGIKTSGALDVSLVASDSPCVAAGVYTSNLVRAASIDWNRKLTPSHRMRAVVINSGNANACTGQEGKNNNQAMATSVAQQLGCDPDQVLVLSTGIIGHQLPMQKVNEGIGDACRQLSSDVDGFVAASEAILTTDSGRKTVSRMCLLDSRDCRLLGMAKGAGMIGPKMATMLGVITTDASLSAEQAQEALSEAVNCSFNRISVESHTSTNDAVILLANSTQDPTHELNPVAFNAFKENLAELCIELAKMIPSDGEGATHLITISIVGAVNDEEADVIARTVANSNLVKTAVTGGDPNWGRIVSAVGYCEGVSIVPEDIRLKINDVCLFQNGTPVDYNEKTLSESMRTNAEVRIDLEVGQGKGVGCHWTSDLTTDYVRFNSEYST